MNAETPPHAATPDQPPGPVTAGERFEALDTLRGVAVLGILIMNIYAFAMPFSAYMNPLLMGGTEWYNLGTWFATHVLADQKFMTIFSMMFGAGAVLMWERAEARGAKFGRIYYRRMFWLLVIGLLHAYFVWFGDILVFYAVIGMLVYPARKWRPRTLIVLACLLLPVGMLMNHGAYYYVSQLRAEVTSIRALQEEGATLSEDQQATLEEWDEMGSFLAPTAADVQKDLDVYLGDYAGILADRIPKAAGMQVNGIIFFGIWRIGGLMLLGMAFLKLGILSGRAADSTYRRLMLFGYGLGLPLTLFSAYNLHAHGFDGVYVLRVGGIPNYIGSVLVALGHIGLVMHLVRRGLFAGLMERFSAVGRMAFTNYLMHSLVLTTIFYGYGLGLYGEIPRAAQMLFVAGMLGLQLTLSPWWLARYRFGPAEWLWRSLTYWQRQRFRT